jgi:peptidyl-tRNA hydrolase
MMEIADWVVGKFTGEEMKIISKAISELADAIPATQ